MQHVMTPDGAPRLGARFPVSAKFPSELILFFGLGEVGRVYLTFAPDGAITKAEADLLDAPYKHMIIDDPSILMMFSDRGDGIDIKPASPLTKFRLDPIEIIEDEEGGVDLASFDTGRLVDVTHLSNAARIGLPQKDASGEGAVHRRIRETFESQLAKESGESKAKTRQRFAPPGTITQDSSRGSTRQSPDRVIMAKNEPITPDGSLDRFGETQQGNNQALETPPRSQSYSTKPAPTANMSAEAALTKSGKAALALQRVLDSLDDADGELYYQFATVTRKEIAKDEDNRENSMKTCTSSLSATRSLGYITLMRLY
jgi:hypothetical protein